MLFRSMNVNIDFFRRFSAENKAKMADSLTDSQVQRMNLDTLSRIIKEACTEANYRTVYISRDLRVSNGWNSELEMVSCAKRKEPVVWFYVQFWNTDSSVAVPLADLFKGGDLHFKKGYMDRYGGTQTKYFSYSAEKILPIKKAIIVSCIKEKYKDKLRKAV